MHSKVSLQKPVASEKSGSRRRISLARSHSSGEEENKKNVDAMISGLNADLNKTVDYIPNSSLTQLKQSSKP